MYSRSCLCSSRVGTATTADKSLDPHTTAFSDDYAAEAEERWVAGYTRNDWVQIKADGDALQALVDAKRGGVEPGLAQFLHDIVVESPCT